MNNSIFFKKLRTFYEMVSTNLGAVVVTVLSLCFSGSLYAGPTQWAKGHILVEPRQGLPYAEFDRILSKNGARSQGLLPGIDVHIVEVPPQAEQALVNALSRNRHIEFAELDGLIAPNNTIPNDPKFPNAWHLSKIQAPAAWDFSLGNNVTVAILDSGVEATHPDLEGQILSGWNVVSNNSNTSDVRGHGTAVAGTVAAASNNGKGVAAVAWNTSLLPVRITNRSDGFAYYSDIATAIIWSADHGADVANISYEVNNVSTVTSAAQYMRSKGGVVVVSAGNNSSDLGYPNNPYIVTVAATNPDDSKPSWSNYGSFIDVAAPGNYIWTTSPGGSYGQWYGNSFSAPTAAGVVALIKAANPSLSAVEVENVLENSADDLSWTGYDLGSGRVNASNAVQLAMNMQSQPADTKAPTVSFVSPGSGANVNGLVSVDVYANDNVGVTEVTLEVGGQTIGTDSVSPYRFTWDSTKTADGSAVLNAYAYDAAGNEGSATVNVTVENTPVSISDTTPPSVTINSPADGSIISTRSTTISASAQDNVRLSNLSLYIDGKLIKSVLSTSMSEIISYNWKIQNVSSGSHTIKAIAKDAAANMAMQTIQVLVGSSTGGPSKGSKGNGKK